MKMKHDDFYDEIWDLASAYKKTPWWKFLKTRFLRNQINLRWHGFIEELSDEHNDDTSGDTG